MSILRPTSSQIHVDQESNKFPVCPIDSNYEQLWPVMKSYEKIWKVVKSYWFQL